MKAHLLFRDEEFDPTQPLPEHAAELTLDLGSPPCSTPWRGRTRSSATPRSGLF